ncbi:MAG: hypothetical protein ACRDTT_25335, partial [Pseudonocardiaceae bacterium]
EHVHDSGTEVIEDFCGDLLVRHDFEVDVYFSGKPHGSDGLIYFADRFRGSDSWTNLANDKAFTIVFNSQQKDLRVTDNGDGTLTILIKSRGQQKVYGPDGQRLFLDAGIFSFEILVDHGGTPTDPSDDEFLADLGVVKVTGRSDTAGRDFCEDFREFTS